MTTLDDVKKFTLKTFTEPDGKLIPIELDKDIPFEVKRMFTFMMFTTKMIEENTVIIKQNRF